jgi:hypothetical protein
LAPSAPIVRRTFGALILHGVWTAACFGDDVG